jgi:hypothetical protein
MNHVTPKWRQNFKIYLQFSLRAGSWGSVAVETSSGLYCAEFEARQGQYIFYFPKPTRQALGHISLLFYGFRRSFPEIKGPEREVDYSLQSSAEVRIEWSYTSTLPTCLQGVGR